MRIGHVGRSPLIQAISMAAITGAESIEDTREPPMTIEPMEYTYHNSNPHVKPTRPIKRDKPKVSRNALCSCGSGKKVKKCCNKS